VDPEDRKYTQEHEWVMIEGGIAVVGITDFAQDQLGDVVYVELPAVGDRVHMMQPFGVIESVKTASDLYSPVTGEVVEINESLTDAPQMVNDAPYAQGWLIKVRPDDPTEIESLMNAQQYIDQIGRS
jgi:glycine cleavage system H protein